MNHKNHVIAKEGAPPNFKMTEKCGRFWSSFFWLIMLFVFACSSRVEFAGIYRTNESTDKTVSELELKADGEGIWRVGDYEETFSWHPKRKDIRLNTKKGGVLVARIHDDVLDITLPGGKRLFLVKVQ